MGRVTDAQPMLVSQVLSLALVFPIVTACAATQIVGT